MKKKQKHWLSLLLGFLIMLIGSTLATAHFHLLGWIPVNIVDGFAYFLHGAGAIPFIRFIEPLWELFSSAINEV